MLVNVAVIKILWKIYLQDFIIHHLYLKQISFLIYNIYVPNKMIITVERII